MRKIIHSKAVNYMNNKQTTINYFQLKKTNLIILLFIILFLALFYFIIDLSSLSLVAHDEGLYARRSRLIEESINWFSSPFSTPHHKTLGSYWLIALSIRLFGNSELSLRLPSILSSFVCLFISYFIALKVSNKSTALISLLSLSSMPLWIQYSRYASPDLPFVLCVLLVIFFFLQFLDSKDQIHKFLYIFSSGLFVSTAFFIRSYMAFVPLIGLTPFFFYQLLRSNYKFKLTFSIGIIVGFIPTFLNLFYSYKDYGLVGITALFHFAKKQAIGVIDVGNLLIIPLNYFYLTFPIGLLFLLLLVFTSSNNSIKFPLLIYIYPILSLLILLCMSTSYPHYYLFLLPSLSLVFAYKIQCFSTRFSSSNLIIKYFLTTIMVLMICMVFAFILFFNQQLMVYSHGRVFLLYVLLIIIILSYVFSIRVLFNSKSGNTYLIRFFYNIFIPQYISLSLLFNFGFLGSPNYKTKLFLNDVDVSSIIKSNTIHLFNVDSKIQTLLLYYLPSSKIVKSSFDVNRNDYIITSEDIYFKNYQVYKSIKKFDNHMLLMKISK